MRQFLIVGLLAGLLVGCGDTHESVMEDTLTQMEAAVTALEGVKSDSDVPGAVKTLDAIKIKMQALEKSADALGKLSDDEEKAMKKKFEDRLSKIMQRMMTAGAAVTNRPELAAKLDELMRKSK